MNIDREYRFKTRDLYFKHQITRSPECESFSMHTHNMYELLYFVSGDATFVIEDKRYKLKKGDLLLIRPLKYHFIQIDSSADYERYDILFDERTLNIDNTDKVREEIEVINILSNPIVSDIFKRLDFYASKLSKDDFFKVTLLLIKELFYTLGIERSQSTQEISEINSTLSRALKYINENLFTVKSVCEVSDTLFITESYLYRLFKSELHKSPQKYIRDKRLLAAQSLIQMGNLPTEIYERCGFSDYTSFYRNYREYFGYSPSREKEYSIEIFEDMH